MKYEEITDGLVKSIGDNIRKFNQNSPPIPMSARGTRENLQSYVDRQWYSAIRWALEQEAES